MSRTSVSRIRVRYAETDQMGVAWHGNVFAWFEVGRTDLLRELGTTCRKLDGSCLSPSERETGTGGHRCPLPRRGEGQGGGSMKEEGVRLPVVEASARYHRPVLYDDVVEVRTVLARHSGVRVGFEYAIHLAGTDEPLVTGRTAHAAVDRGGRPRRLPEPLRRLLA